MSSQYVTLPETGGSSAGVTSFNTLTGAVTISAGTNITLTTVGNNIAISASGGGGGSGTVTSVSVVSANGFAGTVATATTTPAITLSTSITGILSGNGTAISAASTTGSGSVVLATSPTLVTPALGTPSALVGTNITGTASGLTAGNVTTNANLTGPITSSGNATAIASQTGTGTTFVMSASPTITGSITVPAGSNSTASIDGGTANTGLTFPSASTVAVTSGGSEVARFGVNGLVLGSTTTTDTFPLVVHTTAGGNGIELYDASTHAFNIFANSNAFEIQSTSATFFIYSNNTNQTNFGTSNISALPGYSWDFRASSANTTPLTTLAFASSGSTQNLPIAMMGNNSSTVNTNAGWGMFGSSHNPMGLIWTTHQVQTSGSEQASISLAAASAGVLTQVSTWDHLGNQTIPGSYKTSAAQTTLTGSAGTAICSQPFQGASYKKVCIYLNGYTDAGTQVYTFPTAFTQTPLLSGLAGGVSGATVSTTTITFTTTLLSGFVFAEGY